MCLALSMLCLSLRVPARLRCSAQSSNGARAERVGAPLGSAQRGRGAAEAAAEPLRGHAQALAHACVPSAQHLCLPQVPDLVPPDAVCW